MTTILDKIQSNLQKLKSFHEEPSTLADREKTIRQLKIDLTFLQNIPPTLVADPKECILAREVYEYATFLSVEKHDIEGFERHMNILKTYYDEFDGLIPESQKKYAILGLYLLYLLSYNKISEYHTEIELIPIQELSNIYISVPVFLEQYFVEGSYNKILTAKHNVPLASYQFFIDKFVDAIRYEIARSAEKAYESLKIHDMQKLFMINSEAELKSFISANNLKENIAWNIQGDRVQFKKEQKELKEIPSVKMIQLNLEYATELNRII